MLFVKETDTGLLVKVFILPKSSKNMVSGLYEDAIKIKLTAPPVDGAANKLCIKFLSKTLKLPKSNIEIVSGHTGRKKTILLKYQNDTVKIDEKDALRAQLLSMVC